MAITAIAMEQSEPHAILPVATLPFMTKWRVTFSRTRHCFPSPCSFSFFLVTYHVRSVPGAVARPFGVKLCCIGACSMGKLFPPFASFQDTKSTSSRSHSSVSPFFLNLARAEVTPNTVDLSLPKLLPILQPLPKLYSREHHPTQLIFRWIEELISAHASTSAYWRTGGTLMPSRVSSPILSTATTPEQVATLNSNPLNPTLQPLRNPNSYTVTREQIQYPGGLRSRFRRTRPQARTGGTLLPSRVSLPVWLTATTRGAAPPTRR